MAFLRVFVLLFLAMGAAAHAAGTRGDHIVERALLEDEDGTLSIEQVPRQSFAPTGTILARGYTASVHWLRLRVRPAGGGPAEHSAQKLDDFCDKKMLQPVEFAALYCRSDGSARARGALVLRIRPTFLDQVTLYEPDPERPGAWMARVTGDRVPFMDRDLPAVTLGFIIRPVEPETIYYLRLATTSTSLLHVEALEPKAAALRDLQIHLSEIVCLGLLLWILLWTANDYVLRRDPVVAWFAVNQLFFMSYNVLVMGYGALIFPDAPPGFVDKLSSVVIIATPLFSLLTNRVLIKQFDPHPIATMVFDGLILLDLTALGLLAAGLTAQALQLNAIVVLLIAPALLLFAFSTRREALPGRRTLRWVYGVQAVTLLMTMTPLLGLVPATTWNLDANVIHGVLSGLPMFVLLQLRSRKAKQMGIEAQLSLDLTRGQLEHERRQFDMQNRFMAMLTHELRTPLSVVRMAVGTARVEGEPRRLIDGAFDNMNAIIERCAYADRMEQRLLPVQSGPVDILPILQAAAGRSPAPHRIRITAGSLPPVAADEQLVGVALNNLIENALKYSPEHSMIDVAAETAERSDTPGVLIGVENLPGRAGLPDPARVFEKFYRSPYARSKSGSGLGLYIVQGIATLLGGTAAYQPIEGKVRLTVWLPC
jgi:signal transduction histidine kinase